MFEGSNSHEDKILGRIMVSCLWVYMMLLFMMVRSFLLNFYGYCTHKLHELRATPDFPFEGINIHSKDPQKDPIKMQCVKVEKKETDKDI